MRLLIITLCFFTYATAACAGDISGKYKYVEFADSGCSGEMNIVMKKDDEADLTIETTCMPEPYTHVCSFEGNVVVKDNTVHVTDYNSFTIQFYTDHAVFSFDDENSESMSDYCGMQAYIHGCYNKE